MGGKVLEYEAKTILKKGIELGKEQGIELGKTEGIELGSLQTLIKFVNLDMITEEEAAGLAECSVEEFIAKRELYQNV